ncbi:uncharacterized protein H6S33_000591 [Morchella sextelata]|uniref:uncharacterized protein n=1 Tax=Morchella sextelata TaxID=1174677 RepID=UPI001D0433E1|nr:uncharacterized protein H6S33_000591 [Morchella sextelata]KAH0614955.1 hypothetical protein H6S33_000591 [Morchella sextelata]
MGTRLHANILSRGRHSQSIVPDRPSRAAVWASSKIVYLAEFGKVLLDAAQKENIRRVDSGISVIIHGLIYALHVRIVVKAARKALRRYMSDK